MIISVDHGNKSVKTPHRLFTSGIIETESRLSMQTDTIFWGGKYYSLTEKRIAYMRDKTEDDRFYILTLFAIAGELELSGIKETDDPVDITLLIGLPPAHFGQLHERFEKYFLHNRQVVDFEYNDRLYSIRINRVVCYIQALAAAVTQFSSLKSYPVCLATEGEITLEMEKYFRTMPGAENAPMAKRVLELNADHSAFAALKSAFETDKDKAAKIAAILYSQALLTAGPPLEDTAAYTELVCSLL